MQHYEMLFILSASRSAEELEKDSQEVFGVVEKGGGKFTLKEVFARQKLSYPIKKQTQGVYIITEFDAEPASILAVDTELKHLPVLLRHQIVKKVVKTPEQLESERLLKEKIAAKRVAESEKVRIEEAAKVAQETAAKSKLVEKKEEKMDTQELDKKLEELLDDPMLKD